MYSRFRQDGKHFVLTSQTTQLWRETSRDGYRKCAGKYFQLPLAVVDIRRRRILRSLIEDITRWREDMNFIFEWQIIFYEREERVSKILFLPRENKIHIFKPPCNVFFYYIDMPMKAFLMIFRRFPTTFRRFPKIFQNCSEGQTNVPGHFLRISENFQRFPKIAEDFRGRHEDVSMIHQRI